MFMRSESEYALERWRAKAVATVFANIFLLRIPSIAKHVTTIILPRCQLLSALIKVASTLSAVHTRRVESV